MSDRFSGNDGYGTALRQPEIPPRLVHVFRDLLAQSFDRRKLDLRPQALEEEQLQFGVGQQFDGMEVKDVAFDGEGFGAEGGAIANIGHRLEALPVDTQPGDVYAVGRNQLVIAREVDGGHSVLVAVAAPPSGIA